MNRLVLPVLLALVAAGCAAPGEDDGDGGSPPPAGGARFLAPQDLGKGGSEPVVVLSPEGDRIYVAAQDADGGSPHVWISKDGGASWVERRPNAQGGGEVDIAAGPGGMVYLTQLGARGNVVSVSRDRGETWTTAPLGGASQYFDREWMAVDSQGRAFVIAREFGTTTSTGVARSDDKGLTWPPRGKAWTALDEPGEANGPIVAVGNVVHLVYVCRGGNGVCLSTTRDGGLTWDQQPIIERDVSVANVYPALAVGNRGLIVTWSDASAGSLAVYTAHSADGAAWSAPRRVSPEGGTATLPWVAARDDAAWIVYLRVADALRATDCPDADAAAWIPYARRLTPTGDATGDEVALTTQPVHTGIISPPVGQTCSGAARDRNFGDFFTAALTPDKKLIVAVSSDRGDPSSTRDLIIREA